MQNGSLPTDRNILFIIEEKHGTTKFMKKDITQIRINSNQLEGGHDLEAKIIGFQIECRVAIGVRSLVTPSCMSNR